MRDVQGAVLKFEGGVGLLQLPVPRYRFLVPAAQFGVLVVQPLVCLGQCVECGTGRGGAAVGVGGLPQAGPASKQPCTGILVSKVSE
ncbi:hypothetical protein [Streptomyces sp. LN245]|uniref:hypothetical protein n=1 Tax=Streptomyces sp. LN245 TaxID=3112975 RepID=UPI00371FACB3